MVPTRDGHQAADHSVSLGAREDLPVEYSNLFAECLPCGQQRLNDRQEGAIACRGFAHAGGEQA